MEKLKAFFKNPFVHQQTVRFARLFAMFFTPALFGLYHAHALTIPAIGAAIAAAAEVAWKGTWPFIKAKFFTDESDRASAN